MTSYLSSWFSSAPAPASEPTLATPTVVPPEDEDKDGSATETEDDVAPAFPALNSAQRASSSVPRILTDNARMPPPPNPSLAVRNPGLAPPPSGGSRGGLALPPSTSKPIRAREKVALQPGYGPLDWANLKASGKDLRGVETLLRVTPSMLKAHNKKDDAWTAIYGKVYNMTAYLPFHPGGEKELMRVAGRDGTKLFAVTHAWVNADFMLDQCMVGFLVPEPAS